jgi:septal ring-binding cell division protein DamX
MRTVEAIIADLKHQIHWSQPNIRFNELTALVNELENTLSPSEAAPQPSVEEIATADEIWDIYVEEPVVEEVVEETVVEEPTVEETVTEEPVVAKKTTKKK